MTRDSPPGIGRCPEPADVTGWRRRRLLEAGFDRGVADWLASSEAIDLHALLQLVDRGCPPDLAVRILIPIGDGDPPA